MPQKERCFDMCPQIQIYSTAHSDDKQLYILITNLFGRFSCICILFFSMNKLQAPGAICRNRPASPWILSVKGSEGEPIFELQASGTFCKHALVIPWLAIVWSKREQKPNIFLTILSFMKMSWSLNPLYPI